MNIWEISVFLITFGFLILMFIHVTRPNMSSKINNTIYKCPYCGRREMKFVLDQMRTTKMLCRCGKGVIGEYYPATPPRLNINIYWGNYCFGVMLTVKHKGVPSFAVEPKEERMKITELVQIEKYLEYNLGKRIVDKDKDSRKKISGVFKEEGSDKEISGDVFLAYDLCKCSALEVYSCYVNYFNYTIQRPNEKKRIAIGAEWIKEEEDWLQN